VPQETSSMSATLTAKKKGNEDVREEVVGDDQTETRRISFWSSPITSSLTYATARDTVRGARNNEPELRRASAPVKARGLVTTTRNQAPDLPRCVRTEFAHSSE